MNSREQETPASWVIVDGFGSGKHYARLPQALKLALGSSDDAAFAAAARRCFESEASRERAAA